MNTQDITRHWLMMQIRHMEQITTDITTFKRLFKDEINERILSDIQEAFIQINDLQKTFYDDYVELSEP